MNENLNCVGFEEQIVLCTVTWLKMTVCGRSFSRSGIAINKDGVIYFADGANIRTVDRSGTIRTIIGDQDQPGEWKPMPCHQAVKFEDVSMFFSLNNLSPESDYNTPVGSLVH